MSSELRVAFLGAASVQWGYGLTRDFIVMLSSDSVCAQRNPVLVLEDVDAPNLERTHRLARKIAERTGNKVRIECTTNQRESLAGAHFVVTCLAVGGLEAMQYDLEIPYEYGIYQPVGDTISIGGAIRAARNIPAFLSIANDMKDVSAEHAWMLNISNPMSTLTRAVARESGINVVGLCHELYGGMWLLADWLGFDRNQWRRTRDIGVVGINHCGWLQKLRIDGDDVLPRLRKFIEEQGINVGSKRLWNSDVPERRSENLKMVLFLKHGVFPYSGDRHNAEFFSEFLNEGTNKGADYGVMLTTIQERLVHWRGRARQDMNALIAGSKEIDLNVSSEAASRIIKAIAMDEAFYDISNLPYHDGNLPGVPDGAVIERMCVYDGGGAHPEKADPLPDPLQEHLAMHAQNIEDVVDASVKGDRALMIRSLRRDPLLKNMDAARIPELWDRLAEKNRAWLHPRFFG